MEPEEAIRILEVAKAECEWNVPLEYQAAFDAAIEAMEKHMPKKPGYTKLMYKCNGEDIEINHPECPYCRTHGLSLWDAAIPVGDKYCKRCGQAIGWEDE